MDALGVLCAQQLMRDLFVIAMLSAACSIQVHVLK